MQKNGTASAIENRLDSLKTSVGERAGQLKDKAMEAKDVVVENGGAALNRVGAFIKDNPFVAIGIAFGVGYIAIRMFRK
jgi:ElaB/YqjD/DUF883 family membrane-anchored ribosome-binding protein